MRDTFEEEERVLDLSHFRFDQFKNMIYQERKNQLVRDIKKPASVTIGRVIEVDIVTIPVSIASIGYEFSIVAIYNVK